MEHRLVLLNIQESCIDRNEDSFSLLIDQIDERKRPHHIIPHFFYLRWFYSIVLNIYEYSIKMLK